ncbi:condensation domain-containing protein [Streptomyces sp. NPDC017673]|uniref:condensation domain-containing protein n=1 Tax=unclassified Streptomyces TaxID=2593676 RepID=UPI0037B069CB
MPGKPFTSFHGKVRISGAQPAPLSPRSYPASYAQQRLWFLAQLPGGDVAYNETLAFELLGPLDRGALAGAFDALTRRHETLRSRLVAEDGEVRQHVDRPGTGFALAFEDLSGSPDAADGVLALQEAEARTPFDLAAGPLGRGRLVILGAERHVLLLTFHHSVYDGRSMDVMMTPAGGGGVDWLHALPLAVRGEVGRRSLETARWACLDTVAALRRALADVPAARRPRVWLLSYEAQPVTGEVVRPEAGLLAAAVRVPRQELGLSLRWADLPGPEPADWVPHLADLPGGFRRRAAGGRRLRARTGRQPGGTADRAGPRSRGAPGPLLPGQPGGHGRAPAATAGPYAGRPVAGRAARAGRARPRPGARRGGALARPPAAVRPRAARRHRPLRAGRPAPGGRDRVRHRADLAAHARTREPSHPPVPAESRPL